ncbi:MAG: hypothetical protein M1819_003549 [Sarea resinae]|nr:MAG: hypothetical protein M1819_003549 [Sarea resinae]
MDAFNPQQTTELVSRIGARKSHMRIDKLWWNSFMAGPLLGFGCASSLCTTASPWYQENAPGLIRTIGALVFPIGLVMVVLSGADLFTGDIMFMTVAFLHRRVTIWDVLKIWVVSFFGNLAGILFFMAIIIGYGGVFDEAVYKNESITGAISRAQVPQWHQIFLKAIGANWLVCFAVYGSISARDITGKILACWWPPATFVALALDHVIANMFFIPLGIWNGAPFGVGYYIWKSMIPAALGNILGGTLFVGVMYWYLYLAGEGTIKIDSSLGNFLDAAMEAGGPMPPNGRSVGESKNHSDGTAAETTDDSGPIDGQTNRQLKSSGQYMTSGIGQELGPETYTENNGLDRKDHSPDDLV